MGHGATAGGAVAGAAAAASVEGGGGGGSGGVNGGMLGGLVLRAETREEAAALYAKEDSFWRHNTSADSVLVYQLHDFDAEALRLCRNVTVLTQHRNLLDAYASAVAAFGMSNDV